MLAQTERLDGIGPATSVRLRVSVDTLSSTGNGCDVLVYLGRKLPPRNSFHLQRGSLLLCDARSMQDALSPAIPEGVIVYPVPFADLHQRHGRRSEKEVIAIGVLAHLLGMPEEVIRRRLRPDFRTKYFDIGVSWASKHLERRDICAFP
ncbi:MAG: 2-oxoacid:acceptor oxidoreductase family protein, partial [Nitrospirota bacterium]